MFGLSAGHLIVVLVVVILVFGTKKLRNMGGDLGAAIKGFKEGMKAENETASQTSLKNDVKNTDDTTIDVTTRDRQR